MDKAPAFQFYPKDFLSDANVTIMNNEQLGAYIRLMCHEWIEHRLPGDPKKLAKLSGLGKRWNRLSDTILNCFESKGDFLVHPRLQKERFLQEARRAKMSDSGLKGANKRWGSHSHPKPTPMANDSSSSSSSSSTANKRDIRKIFNKYFPLFWEIYPLKKGKAQAEKAFRIVIEKTDPEIILEGVREYSKEQKAKANFPKYVKMPQGWLSDKRWTDVSTGPTQEDVVKAGLI